MDSGRVLGVRPLTQQSDGLWFLLSSHSVDNQGPLQNSPCNGLPVP